MRITPLDIQKHRFRTTFRGHDPAEVRAFLAAFAEQYEMVLRENAQLREQSALLREQVREHEDRERILKDTLLAAQAAAEQVREQARREGELVVKEAELRAERILDVARERIARHESRLVELKTLRRDLVHQVKGMLARQGGLLADWETEEGRDNLEFLDVRAKAAGTAPERSRPLE
jgi:cell division initiation protein